MSNEELQLKTQAASAQSKQPRLHRQIKRRGVSVAHSPTCHINRATCNKFLLQQAPHNKDF